MPNAWFQRLPNQENIFTPWYQALVSWRISIWVKSRLIFCYLFLSECPYEVGLKIGITNQTFSSEFITVKCQGHEVLVCLKIRLCFLTKSQFEMRFLLEKLRWDFYLRSWDAEGNRGQKYIQHWYIYNMFFLSWSNTQTSFVVLHKNVLDKIKS